MPRTPCFKLGIKMGDPTFPKKFLASGKLGIYFRVQEEGDLAAGDKIELVRDEQPVALRSLWHLCFVDDGNADLAARILSRYPPLASEWRKPLEQRAAEG